MICTPSSTTAEVLRTPPLQINSRHLAAHRLYAAHEVSAGSDQISFNDPSFLLVVRNTSVSHTRALPGTCDICMYICILCMYQYVSLLCCPMPCSQIGWNKAGSLDDGWEGWGRKADAVHQQGPARWLITLCGPSSQHHEQQQLEQQETAWIV